MSTSNRRTNSPEQGTENIEESTEAARQAFDQAGDAIAEKSNLQEEIATAAEAAQDALHAAGDQLADYARSADRAIRKNPYPALGIALGVGLLCGYLIKRK